MASVTAKLLLKLLGLSKWRGIASRALGLTWLEPKWLEPKLLEQNPKDQNLDQPAVYIFVIFIVLCFRVFV
jgi:hypothetical protein